MSVQPAQVGTKIWAFNQQRWAKKHERATSTGGHKNMGAQPAEVGWDLLYFQIYFLMKVIVHFIVLLHMRIAVVLYVST